VDVSGAIIGAFQPPHDPDDGVDGVDGVDVTRIRWMLSRALEERLAVLQGFVDSVAELTRDSPAAKIQRGT
jgi:hypothetical protein